MKKSNFRILSLYALILEFSLAYYGGFFQFRVFFPEIQGNYLGNHFKMTELFVIKVVILCVIISCVKSDICDFCTCTKSDCEPAIDNSTKECFDQIDEFFNCNANDQTFKMSQQTFDINSIQWPHRNTTVSARFNNFKLTYLTKYFLFTLCLFFLHYQKSDFIVISVCSFFQCFMQCIDARIIANIPNTAGN